VPRAIHSVSITPFYGAASRLVPSCTSEIAVDLPT
jgi:hypothetical protein